jgi:hypothetical protein
VLVIIVHSLDIFKFLVINNKDWSAFDLGTTIVEEHLQYVENLGHCSDFNCFNLVTDNYSSNLPRKYIEINSN